MSYRTTTWFQTFDGTWELGHHNRNPNGRWCPHITELGAHCEKPWNHEFAHDPTSPSRWCGYCRRRNDPAIP